MGDRKTTGRRRATTPAAGVAVMLSFAAAIILIVTPRLGGELVNPLSVGVDERPEGPMPHTC